MHVVGADQLDHALALEHLPHDRLHACEAHGDPVGSRQLGDLGQLRRPLRVDEADRLEVEHDRVNRWLGRVHDLPDPVVERVRGGEEEPAVMPEHRDPRERLVARVIVELAEDPGPGSRPSSGVAGAVAT